MLSCRSRVLALVVFLCPFVCCWTFAQSGNQGSIAGTVTDSTGAVVSGATVTITNESTNVSRSVQTDSRGFYDVESLEPGSYMVSTSATGFPGTITKGGGRAPGERRR